MAVVKKKIEELKEEDGKKAEEGQKFKGRFIGVIGRRKTATAQVRLYKNGSGIIVVNNEKINQYFTPEQVNIIIQPLKLAGLSKDFNFSVIVRGGGKNGQAVAVRHGITRALIDDNKELRPSLKAKGLITRDSREKERKKPGLKKARRAPQWAKR